MEERVCYNCSSKLERFSAYTEKRVENKWIKICADCGKFKAEPLKGDIDSFLERLVVPGFRRY